MHRRGAPARSRFLRCDGESRPPVPEGEAARGDGVLGRPRPSAAGRALALVRQGLAHLLLGESTLALKAFERALALDPKSKEARAGLRKATALRETTDFYRGVYECFGTHLAGDPGCEECEIRVHCREVTP